MNKKFKQKKLGNLHKLSFNVLASNSNFTRVYKVTIRATFYLTSKESDPILEVENI